MNKREVAKLNSLPPKLCAVPTMRSNYIKKVTFYRVILLALMSLCYFLQNNKLTDYAILLVVLVLFGGIFSMSDVQVTERNVKIRKNYFWALVGLKWTIDFEKIISLTKKEYEIETLDDAWIFVDGMFTFFTPKVKWLTSKLSYRDNGVEKDIELKVNRDDFREIEFKIRNNR